MTQRRDVLMGVTPARVAGSRSGFVSPDYVTQRTRSVGIGATDWVHARLLEQRQAGTQILLISQDLVLRNLPAPQAQAGRTLA